MSEDTFETNPLFQDDHFAFPSISSDFGQKPGFYYPILDVTYISTDHHDLRKMSITGHEIAHRLFAIDSVAIRLARQLASVAYARIWWFLSILAEDRATLIGRGESLTIDKADQPKLIEELIRSFIKGLHWFNWWIAWSLESVEIVYEMVVLEAGLSLLRQRCTSRDDMRRLEEERKKLLKQSAKKQAHALYHAYPTYWREKELAKEGVSEEKKRSALAALRQQLQQESTRPGKNPCFAFLSHQEVYETLFEALYEEYEKNLNSSSIYHRIGYINNSIASPMTLNFTQERNIRYSRNNPNRQWATGQTGQQRDMNVQSLADARRVAQFLELSTLSMMPEFYFMPVRMMTVLDNLLLEDYTADMNASPDGATTMLRQANTATKRIFITPFSPSLITLEENRKTGVRTIALNEDVIQRGTVLLEPARKYSHSIVDEWWRWLFLFETIRKGIASGTLLTCPFKGYPLSCPTDCPIKANLAFLQKHSQLVAEQFCDK